MKHDNQAMSLLAGLLYDNAGELIKQENDLNILEDSYDKLSEKLETQDLSREEMEGVVKKQQELSQVIQLTEEAISAYKINLTELGYGEEEIEQLKKEVQRTTKIPSDS